MPGDLSAPKRMTNSSLGKPLDCSLPGSARVDLGRAGPERGEIVVVLVARAQDQRPAAGFLDRVVEFMASVGGIDVDENDPGERGAELRQNPFADIGRPDADPVALLEAQLAQADGQVFGPAQEVGVAPAHVLVTGDERRALRAPRP